MVGDAESEMVGDAESEMVGEAESEMVGDAESEMVGDAESEMVGDAESEMVGDAESDTAAGITKSVDGGAPTFVLSPVPNWPYVLDPQQRQPLLAVIITQVWYPPRLTRDTPVSTLVVGGVSTYTFSVDPVPRRPMSPDPQHLTPPSTIMTTHVWN
jgi:hypothetical protein